MDQVSDIIGINITGADGRTFYLSMGLMWAY